MIEPDAAQLEQLRQAAAAHNLTMRPHSVPGRSREQFSKSFAPGTIFAGVGDFFWLLVGHPNDIVSFLKAVSPLLVAYMAGRGARSVRLKSGDVEVELKGSADVEKRFRLSWPCKPRSASEAGGPTRRRQEAPPGRPYAADLPAAGPAQ